MSTSRQVSYAAACVSGPITAQLIGTQRFLRYATPQNRLCRQPCADRTKRACAHWPQSYGDVPQAEADVIVALGGDGFMLQTLHATQGLDVPVYGMNRGTVGFLMNEYSRR